VVNVPSAPAKRQVAFSSAKGLIVTYTGTPEKSWRKLVERLILTHYSYHRSYTYAPLGLEQLSIIETHVI
jgi:hypothetical protein